MKSLFDVEVLSLIHILGEVQETAAGYRQAAEFIRGTRPTRSGLAAHFSGLAWWMFEFQPMVRGFSYGEKLLNAFYRPVQQAQLRPDIIDPAASLEPYQLVCSPVSYTHLDVYKRQVQASARHSPR